MKVEGSGPASLDEDGFAQWYRSEFSSAVTTVRLVIGDGRLAEEAVSEAFARALASWPKVRRMDSPGGWLYQVAVLGAATGMCEKSLAHLKVGDLNDDGGTLTVAGESVDVPPHGAGP